MNTDIKPFIINSNICYEKEEITSYEKFMHTVNYNIGNSYITYCFLKSIFGGLVKVPEIKDIFRFDYTNSDRYIDIMNNECSLIYLNIQDFIREDIRYVPLNFEGLEYIINKLNKPIIIAGLGANSFKGFEPDLYSKLDKRLVHFLHCLSEHCIEIGVRGEYTADVLSKLGITNVNVIGCPSFYELGKHRKIIKASKFDINKVLCSSGFFNAKGLGNNYRICQDFQEERIIRAIAFGTYSGMLSDTVIKRIMNKQYRIFSSIKDWHDFVKDFQLTVGWRMHGAIMSLNSGVPAICCNKDTRVAEMSALLKMPVHLDVGPETDIEPLFDTIDIDEMNKVYPVLYENYLEFCRRNNIPLFDENKNKSDIKYHQQPSLPLYTDFHEKNILENTIRLRVQCNILEENIQKINNTLNYVNENITEIKNKPPFYQYIFSIKNRDGHKIWTILGLKFKFRRHKKHL